jgi:phosphoribosylaminoimidazole-succinocarboxamide synthase
MKTPADAISRTDLPGLRTRGKVRDIYELPDRLMIVATDRISAFDVVMDDAVPGKGRVLTRITEFWLQTLAACTPHHLDYVVTKDRVPAGFEAHAAQLAERSMVVRRADVLPIECVVRGYVVGGGWKEYQASGAISGVHVPDGLRLADELPAPIFTPSTKAASGHDEPISFDRAVEIGRDFARSLGRRADVGAIWVEQARARALEIYSEARRHAAARGILIADTKFEFGVCDGQLLLVDEVLTPDSSRFWPAADYRPGSNPPSFDKQFLRDYLETLAWNKQPPPPPLPADVLARTAEKYEEALRLLTGPALTD